MFEMAQSELVSVLGWIFLFWLTSHNKRSKHNNSQICMFVSDLLKNGHEMADADSPPSLTRIAIH